MHYGDPTISIHAYARRHPDRGVRVSCGDCGVGFTLATRRLVDLLERCKLGDERSPVAQGAKAARAIGVRCVRCGGRAWEAWPLEGEWLAELGPTA